MKKLLLSAAFIAFVGPALATDAMKAAMITPDELTWKDHPALAKGAQFTVLMGDPTKAGELFVQRVKFPPNFQIPAHTHGYAENVTVITGTFVLGMGEKLDMEKGQPLKAGSFFTMPARHAHYAWIPNEETVIQVQGIGPAGIDYINPADDPRKQ